MKPLHPAKTWLITSGLLLGTVVPPTFVFAKPPPAGMNTDDAAADTGSGKKAPPKTGSSNEQSWKEVNPELVAKFKTTYKKNGRPKLLILAGIDRRAGNTPRGQGMGDVASGAAAGGGVGSNISFFDDTGITEALANAIGGNINDDGKVRLVDLEALADRDRREMATRAQNDTDGAIDAMARKVNADIVLYIKFTPLSGEARGRRTRADDDRADARQRRRDGIRQAEREEIRFGIGTQHTEGEHHESCERARQRRRIVAVHDANGPQFLGHRVG